MAQDDIYKVIVTFTQLQNRLYQFASSYYHDSHLNAWLSPPCKPENARKTAFHVISQLEYTDEQEPRSTIQHPGIVGASQETLELIVDINHAKDRFKSAMQQLKSSNKNKTADDLNLQIDNLLNKRHLRSKAILRRTGLARLNLKQCYRHIPVLSTKPTKVSWTWAHTRAIRKISVAMAKQSLLKRAHTPGINLQLDKLAQLADQEHLAIIQEVTPHLRANIVTSSANNESKRKMISAALPIFYPETANQPLPFVSAPGEKQLKNMYRLSRSDQKIEQEVFIPALRAHRYL